MDSAWLFIFTQSPFDGRRAKDGLDALLAAAAFDQPVQLVFWGDGVLQLHRPGEPEAFGLAPLAKQLSALPMYGVDRIYADKRRLGNVESTLNGVSPIQQHELQTLIQQAKQLLVF